MHAWTGSVSQDWCTMVIIYIYNFIISYMSKVVNKSIANSGSEAFIQCGAEQSGIIIIWSLKRLVQKGK